MAGGDSYTGQTTGEKRGVAIELPFPPASLSGHNTGHWRTLQPVKKQRRRFSDSDIARLHSEYREAVECGRLSQLAKSMGRSRCVLCEKAKELGLTDAQAARERAANIAGDNRRGKRLWGADRPHPRGFSGKKHSTAAKERSRKASNDWWGSLTSKEKEQRVTNNLKAMLAKNGKIGPIAGGNRESASWKAGWREIADRRIYFRSRWEANYARYLQWLKERGDILDWEYEPETFWFDAIKRGVRSYKPDFRVHELNGSKPLHEVKGWMDARSKTTLKRMAKYHPQERIILIREKQYRAISRFAALIGEWE